VRPSRIRSNKNVSSSRFSQQFLDFPKDIFFTRKFPANAEISALDMQKLIGFQARSHDKYAFENICSLGLEIETK